GLFKINFPLSYFATANLEFCFTLYPQIINIMKFNFSFVVACMFVMMSGSNTFAAIPDGQWCNFEGDPGEFWGSTELDISFANPEKKDGRIVYGSYGESYEGTDEEMPYYDFGKPEINGNRATCKAYHYKYEWNDKLQTGVKKYIGNPEDCTLIYDENAKSITIKMGTDFSVTLQDADRCSLVSVDGGNNINVRKTPVKGEIVGKATKGQMLQLLSISSAPNYGEKWYEVRLPDSTTGFISGKYVTLVPKILYSIPDMFFNDKYNNIYFSHVYEEADPDNAYDRTVIFKRSGNIVMCQDFTGFPYGYRMPIESYGMGVIDGNKIIINRFITRDEGSELFENGDFAGLAKVSCDAEPEIWNYMNNALYNDGVEYNWGMNAQ
ncbi:MAG: SH3 domain-containing protein, partial [Bacteroidales bacterium]|nr:SH3 domain-containing protein [Bacteroidales bacterium]